MHASPYIGIASARRRTRHAPLRERTCRDERVRFAEGSRLSDCMHFCAMLVPGSTHRMNIDLKLLAIVSELNRTRSVSQTAENLDLSQSAVSMSLAKLRKHFNDPLFV